MAAGGLPSVGGFSSMAIWPILMNWQLISSLFPAAKCLGSQIDFQDVLRRFLQTWTGFLLAGAVFFVAFLPLLYNTWKIVSSAILNNWSTKCSIPEHSVYYDRLKVWLRDRTASQSLTTFIAPETDNFDAEAKAGIDFGRDQGSLDVIRSMAKAEPQWNPDLDQLHFWIDGAYFWFKEHKMTNPKPDGNDVAQDSIDVYCFTWNKTSEPIRTLLATAKRDRFTALNSKSFIWGVQHYPHSYKQWRWNIILKREKRPLHTVIMDRAQMSTVVNDIKSFLSRQGVQWYQEKGLPLRLGYLFCGPPGTGKSSFAFALAGTFGLPVYIPNLSLKSLDDSAIEVLFSLLPFHCIIMLEDIDAMKPMQRTLNPKIGPETDPRTGMGDTSTKVQDAAPASQPDKSSSVTLSGLLNVIDGIGASEGRIMIMSTNKIEDLDEALIRAGRADRIVKFTNTTKEQAQQIHEMEDYIDEDITQLAKDFSNRIHNEVFSPALLQQYFKDFRAEPRLAISELDKWMEDPRAYRKPVLVYSPEKVSRGNACDDGMARLLLVKEISVGKISSTVEDLMCLDDLGGYQEPARFDNEKAVTLNGPLLDAS